MNMAVDREGLQSTDLMNTGDTYGNRCAMKCNSYVLVTVVAAVLVLVVVVVVVIVVVVKVKVIPQQAEMAQGVPGRLRSRIFLTFGTARVVGSQP